MDSNHSLGLGPTADHGPTVSYRDFANQQFQRVWDRFGAQEKAIEKADHDLDTYKLTANEFRATLADQAARLVTRDELNQIKSALEIQRLRIDKNENSSANNQGRIWMLAFGIVVFQFVLTVAPTILKH